MKQSSKENFKRIAFLPGIHQKIRKALKARRDLRDQAEMAKKLDKYNADFLNRKIERVYTVAKKPELVGRKIIWQFWQQGINENTPRLVRTCLDSVKKHGRGYEIIVLSRETLSEYIDELPDFVWNKFNTGGFDYPKIANLVRLQLLSAYGGVWIDATIFLTSPIDEQILDKAFFAFQCAKTPPPDAKIFRMFDPAYFSWNPKFLAGMLNSFMVAKPGNKIIQDLLSILLEYWKREEKTGHYFFFQICFNRMVLHKEWKDLNCEIIGDTDCHKLQVVSFDQFDEAIFDDIQSKCSIHKLTYRLDKFDQIPEGSFFDLIVKGKLGTKGK